MGWSSDLTGIELIPLCLCVLCIHSAVDAPAAEAPTALIENMCNKPLQGCPSLLLQCWTLRRALGQRLQNVIYLNIGYNTNNNEKKKNSRCPCFTLIFFCHTMCNYGPHISQHFASNTELDIEVLVGFEQVKGSAVQLKKDRKKREGNNARVHRPKNMRKFQFKTVPCLCGRNQVVLNIKETLTIQSIHFDVEGRKKLHFLALTSGILKDCNVGHRYIILYYIIFSQC